MNDVAELKQFGYVHTQTQGIPVAEFERLRDRIVSDAGDEPGSWVHEWSHEAAELDRAGRVDEAWRYHAMARFPFPDGAPRRAAQAHCVDAFARSATGSALERLDVEAPEGRIRGWAVGLSAAEPKPLLVISGGIVAAKEQYAPMLRIATGLDMAGIVTEMPGVGENTVGYTAKSWQTLSYLLDAVGDRAQASRTVAMALSFSGHLALRCAVNDSRLVGVVTAAAPISDFFTDAQWQRGLPRITVDTLAHLTGVDAEKLSGHIRDWALSDDELTALAVPLYYMASDRDEIIPPGELGHLQRSVRELHVLSHDDEHGAPRHLEETQRWVAAAIHTLRG
ncbi:hydrolase superfamily dihydrolipoamide acyltransferase-like protein [Frankia sp. R43]|uniref:alpha/beta hydrolase n=1 Tax=Frankia sp. R43 TaxID=269536 RepID=UPI0006C9FECD|nr:alpha/beta hydrolase [Frankia sp. R43]KPM52489.1 hydrolase superfamily dihydrolipoamide acyltransferase-like protein [Frankia sp. R43]